MMCELEEEEGWSQKDNLFDLDDTDSTPCVSEQSLDRIACALGGDIVIAPIFESVPQMLDSPNWMQRYAALMVISATGEGVRLCVCVVCVLCVCVCVLCVCMCVCVCVCVYVYACMCVKRWHSIFSCLAVTDVLFWFLAQ